MRTFYKQRFSLQLARLAYSAVPMARSDVVRDLKKRLFQVQEYVSIIRQYIGAKYTFDSL